MVFYKQNDTSVITLAFVDVKVKYIAASCYKWEKKDFGDQMLPVTKSFFSRSGWEPVTNLITSKHGVWLN